MIILVGSALMVIIELSIHPLVDNIVALIVVIPILSIVYIPFIDVPPILNEN